jgi:hypothetical protein
LLIVWVYPVFERFLDQHGVLSQWRDAVYILPQYEARNKCSIEGFTPASLKRSSRPQSHIEARQALYIPCLKRMGFEG